MRQNRHRGVCCCWCCQHWGGQEVAGVVVWLVCMTNGQTGVAVGSVGPSVFGPEGSQWAPGLAECPFSSPEGGNMRCRALEVVRLISTQSLTFLKSLLLFACTIHLFSRDHSVITCWICHRSLLHGNCTFLNNNVTCSQTGSCSAQEFYICIFLYVCV